TCRGGTCRGLVTHPTPPHRAPWHVPRRQFVRPRPPSSSEGTSAVPQSCAQPLQGYRHTHKTTAHSTVRHSPAADPVPAVQPRRPRSAPGPPAPPPRRSEAPPPPLSTARWCRFRLRRPRPVAAVRVHVPHRR